MMKRLFTVIFCLMLCAALVGCAQESETAGTVLPSPPPVASATPAPTPEPPPVIALVCDANAEMFFAGAARFFDGADAVLMQTSEGLDNGIKEAVDAGAKAVIAYIDGAETNLAPLDDAVSAGISVYMYSVHGHDAAEGIVKYGYDATDAQSLVFDTLMTLPNHDTPVRLFGMFTSEQSEAAATFAEGVAQGKIFNKGVYYEDTDEKTPEEWIAEKLTEFYPGMLDAVYAEDERMAKLAFDAFKTADRTDAEVVTAVYTNELINLMPDNGYVLYAEVGPNTFYAGAYIGSQALTVIDGGSAEGLDFEPEMLYASALKEGYEGYMAERIAELQQF